MENNIIVLASSNKHKAKEYQELLKDTDYKIALISEFNIDLNEVDENQKSFENNSLIKAQYVFNKLNQKYPVIADDSGLCVKSLNGFPGIFSARWNVNDDDSYYAKNTKIIELVDCYNNRDATFVCAITYIDNNNTKTFVGKINGEITKYYDCNNANAFGYDPIFYVKELNKTFAQMSLEQKDKISHRGVAFKKLLSFLNNK